MKQDIHEQMCAIGRRAYQRELVDGTGGNFSCRVAGDQFVCTPTQCSKGELTPEDLCVVDAQGRQVAGRRPPSSEILMHLEIYAANPTTGAVVHTHPPFATTFAAVGQTIPAGVLPEGDVFLGPVPLIPYQTPGTRAMGEALRPYAVEHCAALLQSHGAVTWGADLETAYVLSETLEAVCRVVYQARQLGGLKLIPSAAQEELAAIRARLRGG